MNINKEETYRLIAMNERIRADQLYDQMMAMRHKWHEARRLLRAANKGAERNAKALELVTLKYINLIQEKN